MVALQTMAPLTVTIEETTGGMFRLMVRGDAGTNPAGERLERGAPLPVTDWQHFDEADARTEAKALQEYIDEHHNKRKPRKRHQT